MLTYEWNLTTHDETVLLTDKLVYIFLKNECSILQPLNAQGCSREARQKLTHVPFRSSENTLRLLLYLATLPHNILSGYIMLWYNFWALNCYNGMVKDYLDGGWLRPPPPTLAPRTGCEASHCPCIMACTLVLRSRNGCGVAIVWDIDRSLHACVVDVLLCRQSRDPFVLRKNVGTPWAGPDILPGSEVVRARLTRLVVENECLLWLTSSRGWMVGRTCGSSGADPDTFPTRRMVTRNFCGAPLSYSNKHLTRWRFANIMPNCSPCLQWSIFWKYCTIILTS